LQLAENRARVFDELLDMAKAEVEVFAPEETNAVESVTRFSGSGVFKDSHLGYVEATFERQFHRPLPISAKGQTALHTALGFDHSGRVDVAVNPDEPEGIWLREMLEKLRVPYIALRAAIAGKSTGPHIHIGPPSLRLPAAEIASGGGQH
jgi:hypothetical protein